jgi:hypothetical protein
MRRTWAIGFALSLIVGAAHGQSVPPYRFIVRPDSGGQRPPVVRDLGTVVRTSPEIDNMKAALRDLVVAEERYFSAHGKYAADAKALDVSAAKYGQAATKVIFAGRTGWSARATEPSLNGRTCVIFVGPAKDLPNGAPKTALGMMAPGEGIPACDDPQ